MEEGQNFKDLIIPKIKKATADLINNKHSRVALSDFGSIQKKKLGPYFLFFNNTYKNVIIFYFYLILIFRNTLNISTMKKTLIF